MEELQVIETTSGRQFKPWVDADKLQEIVSDPASVVALTSEIASGKQAIAAAINAKGGEASATVSFGELAQDIQSMEIQQVTIDGGQMYAKQMTGDGVLWDLYTILAQMKSQFMVNGYSYNGVLYKYSALIVCEYYKGSDSSALQGADAYFTCDGDFYNYASPNHIWHDSDNGKMNRWVCFLFTDEGARLDITNTAISPRSMYIGGHIGTIEYFVNGRLTDLVCGVEDTDVVDNFKGNYTQAWNFNCIIRNIGTVTGQQYQFNSVKGTLYLQVLNCNFTFFNNSFSYFYLSSDVVNVPHSKSFFTLIHSLIGAVLLCRRIDLSVNSNLIDGCPNLQFLYMPNLLLFNYANVGLIYSNTENLIDITVGALTTNFLTKWNPTNVLADPDKTATLIDNIKNHILARVSDATGGTQLVFTVSTNLYNAIANENIEWQGETMTLADAFLTKNWLFAGA